MLPIMLHVPNQAVLKIRKEKTGTRVNKRMIDHNGRDKTSHLLKTLARKSSCLHLVTLKALVTILEIKISKEKLLSHC